MIRDVQVSFTDSVATGASMSIVGAAGTYLAPNSIDLSPLGAYLTETNQADTLLNAGVNPGRDIGVGQKLWVVTNWTTAAAGGTSVDLQLITSANATLSSAVVVLDLGTQPMSALVRGFRQKILLPSSKSYEQFIGLQAITTGTFTAGALGAFLVLDADSVVRGYANSFSVK